MRSKRGYLLDTLPSTFFRTVCHVAARPRAPAAGSPVVLRVGALDTEEPTVRASITQEVPGLATRQTRPKFLYLRRSAQR